LTILFPKTRFPLIKFISSLSKDLQVDSATSTNSEKSKKKVQTALRELNSTLQSYKIEVDINETKFFMKNIFLLRFSSDTDLLGGKISAKG
jgi:hypothetical protein